MKKSKVLVLMILVFAPSFLLAADGVYRNMGFYLLGALVLIVGIAAVITLMRLLDATVKDKQRETGVLVETVETVEESKMPLWRRWYKDLTKAVPVAREKEILLDHNYDGIRELDNRLPPWWLAMFYISIIFGVVYAGYHHFSKFGKSTAELYEQEMATAKASVDAFLAGQTAVVDENTVVALTDEASLEDGKFIYQLNCTVCHLDNGAGLVGPNLTDEYWINGGSINDLFRTIKYGVPEKGMIAWSSQLRPADMQKVASYILTFQGTNPPNGKAPEGEKYVPEVQ